MILFALSTLALAQAPADACDRFDRADAPDPGPAWTLESGAIGVQDGAARCWAPASLMTHAEARAPWAEARLECRFGLTRAEISYVALVAGFADLDASVFVKVQDNDGSGDFDHVYFYRGNNGHQWSTEYRHALAMPRTGGILRLQFEDDGDVAVLTVLDEDGGALEEFSCAGLLASSGGLGDQIGVGLYGAAYADDFAAGDGCAEPELELALKGDCTGVLTIGARGATGEVMVLAGPLGAAVQSDPRRPCPGLVLALERPVLLCRLGPEQQHYGVNADGRMCGFALQAVDLARCLVSPPLRL